MKGDLTLGSVATHVCFKSRLDVGALFLVEPFGLLRAASNRAVRPGFCLQCRRGADSQGREDKKEADADYESDRSLDDENPTPAIIPSETVHCSFISYLGT